MDNVTVLTWVIQNWELVLLILLVADKVVAITPTPYDDIILTAIKAALKPLLPGNKTEEKKEE